MVIEQFLYSLSRNYENKVARAYIEIHFDVLLNVLSTMHRKYVNKREGKSVHVHR